MYINVQGESKSDLETALHKFKNMVKKSGVLEEVRTRQEFVKKSVKKKRKQNRSIANKVREQKLQEKRNKYNA